MLDVQLQTALIGELDDDTKAKIDADLRAGLSVRRIIRRRRNESRERETRPGGARLELQKCLAYIEGKGIFVDHRFASEPLEAQR